MRAFVLLAAGAIVMSAAPGQASIITLGSTNAESCYHAAEARNTSSRAIEACNIALMAEPLAVPDRVATHVNRGILRMAAGDLVRANQDFDRALALDPDQAEAWLNKAAAEVNGGNVRSAGQMARRALALGTRKPAIAYYILGIVHEESGNLKAAYADFRRARDLAPQWREPAVELARYQLRQR